MESSDTRTLFSYCYANPLEQTLVTVEYKCSKSVSHYSYLKNPDTSEHQVVGFVESYNDANITSTDRNNLTQLSSVFETDYVTFKQALNFFNPNVSLNIIYPIYYSAIRNLLTRSKTLKLEKPKNWFINSSFWGVHPNTELVDAEGESRTIQSIAIGEKLCHGEVVIGKVCFLPPDDMYLYRDMICTGSLVVQDQGNWKSVGFFHNQYESNNEPNDDILKINEEDWEELDEGYPEYMCNLITTTQQFTSAGILIRDFSLIRDNTLFRLASHYL